MRVLTFAGTSREIGQAFGESCRDAIARFYRIRIDIAIEQAQIYGGRTVSEPEVLRSAAACLAPTEAYDPVGYEELLGIAEGAGLTSPQVMALNGLTDLRDTLSWGEDPEGCSAFIAAGDSTANGRLLCGQTWDLATNNMPFVIGVNRQPTEGPETWSMTTTGCLSLIGLNAEGIAVGTTNLRTTDSRPGVVYLSILHRILRATSLEEGIQAVISAPRASGHFYFIADGRGKAAAIECTGTSHHVKRIAHGIHTQCNHCLIPEHRALEGLAPSSSSLRRTDRLLQLLNATRDTNSVDTAKAYFADVDGGADAICRDEPHGISSNGAVIMVPEDRTIVACHGPPSRAKWIDLRGATT